MLELNADESATLNDALWQEIRDLPTSDAGLSISNRGGGYHSSQQLFQR